MASGSQGAPPPVSPPPPGVGRAASRAMEFETGNPAAGALLRGTLNMAAHPRDCEMVVVEGVPGIMTSADFCAFLRPHMNSVAHIRLLRPRSERNRYMVVALVRNGANAATLADALTGRAYLQGLVAETCRVRGVASVQAEEPLFMTQDAAASCAVCLERLDAMAPLVTTLCNHTLHAPCLAQCELNRCPVCRHAHELTPEASVCMTCSDAEDVWMCVVCAYVGCGFYKKKHAQQHFLETHHPFAMNLNELVFWSGERLPASSVWDYISERFVDRLLTADDGKVVELGAAGSRGASSASAPARKSCVPEARVPDQDEALAAAVAASALDHALQQHRAAEAALRAQLAEAHKCVEEARCDAVSARQARGDAIRERKAAGKRAEAAEKLAAQLGDKNAFLKQINDSLLRDQEAWKKRVDAISEVARSAREERDALKEQLRDLMMHLETQATISAAHADPCRGANSAAAAAAAELAGADVLRVGASPRERLAVRLGRRAHR